MSRYYLHLAFLVAITCLLGCMDQPVTGDVTGPGAIPAPDLTLLTPDAPLLLAEDDILTIRWSSSSDCGDVVRILLLSDTDATYVIADSAPNNGRFDWVVPSLSDTDSRYRIRIVDPATGCSDESTTPILVDPGPFACDLIMTVLFAGSRFAVGDSMRINWITRGPACGDSVLIELLKDTVPLYEICSAAANSGSYQWSVTSPRADSTGYSIRITDRVSGAWAESGRRWRIVGGVDPAPDGELELLVPNGGEVWDVNESHIIRWQSTALEHELIQLRLLSESGDAQLIAGDLPNTGSYLWIPGNLPPGEAEYRIRVTAAQSGLSDQSDAPFSLTENCRYDVIYPDGGQTLSPGDLCTIRWQSDGACDESIHLFLANDDGASKLLVSGLPADGEFDWTVSPIGADPNGYRICVQGAQSGASDCSLDPFSITSSCLLSLLYPEAGAELVEGETVNITWFSQWACGEMVSIELLLGETVCQTIASSASNSGSYAWIADPCGISETGYRICITDLTTGTSTISSAPFSIHRECGFNISEPGNGTQWIEGGDYTIRWSRFGNCSQWISIDLLQNGVAVQRIADETENDGAYLWQAGRYQSHEFDYQIRITDLETEVTRTSAGQFSILEPCRISLISPNGSEEFITGDAMDIRWDQNHSCGEQVRIDLIRERSTCRNISPLAENSGDYSWLVAGCDGARTGYRIVITDTRSGVRDTSDAAFEIYAPVYISATATSQGMMVDTNNPDWLDGLELKFSGDGYRIGCPDWLGAHCPGLLLDPTDGTGISFYPIHATSGNGVRIDPSCTAVELKIEGLGNQPGAEAEMYLSTSVSEGCIWPMPVVDYYRTATAYMTGYCVRSTGSVRLNFNFNERQPGDMVFGLTRVSYTFHGWKAR
jgi:Kre9/KNH-like N-terminal Ig-like domain